MLAQLAPEPLSDATASGETPAPSGNEKDHYDLIGAEGPFRKNSDFIGGNGERLAHRGMISIDGRSIRDPPLGCQ